jgi:hypothetical protein
VNPEQTASIASYLYYNYVDHIVIAAHRNSHLPRPVLPPLADVDHTKNLIEDAKPVRFTLDRTKTTHPITFLLVHGHHQRGTSERAVYNFPSTNCASSRKHYRRSEWALPTDLGQLLMDPVYRGVCGTCRHEPAFEVSVRTVINCPL